MSVASVTPSFAVWSPNRHTNAARACMSVLRLAAPQWAWADAPAQAWWLVDGTEPLPPMC